MNMNTAHWHLLLNHAPIMGAIFVTVLFLIALVFRQTFMQKVSLWMLVMVALSTAATYITGDGTKRLVSAIPGVSQQLIFHHESFARVGLLTMFVAGVLSLGGGIWFRKSKLPGWFQITLLIVLLVNIGVLAYISYLGGLIMHAEIR